MMRSATATAPLRMLKAGPLMAAQLGNSHPSGSYLHQFASERLAASAATENLQPETQSFVVDTSTAQLQLQAATYSS